MTAGRGDEAPTPIAVVGPTGSGKSELALDLAERLGGEIVNCDSMQLYRGMDIGTAKVPPAGRRGLPHHLFDVLEVTETASVATYQEVARAAVEEIRSRGAVPIVVGGSMLYVQSLLDDWAFPDTDPEVRAQLEHRLATEGLAALRADLERVDPEAAATIQPTDPRRTVRALEVVELTGRPFSASKPVIGEPRWGAALLGVRCERPELDARLEQRTAHMFAAGLVEEVLGLIPRGLEDGVTARRAIGYAHVLAERGPGGTLDQQARARAEAATVVATRRYVRRQLSWFGRDTRITWVDGSDAATPSPLAAATASLVESGAISPGGRP